MNDKQNDHKENKGFFTRLMDKLDKRVEEKVKKKKSCCSKSEGESCSN